MITKFTCGGLGKQNLKNIFIDPKCLRNVVNQYKIYSARCEVDKGEMSDAEFKKILKYDMI